MSSNEVYSHRADKNDIIIEVSDNWGAFAHDNFGANTCLPDDVVGSSLWDHIADPETRHLYEIILKKVRENKTQAELSFRCDSPETRRFLRLSVTSEDEDSVTFRSELLRTESRSPVELLRSDIDRSDELVKICSMCKKIAISITQWEEVEVAVEIMKLFELNILPQFTHGVCPSCYEIAIRELDSL